MIKNKNTLLWKISKPGQEHISYLFGTIHIWNPAIEQIYHSVLPYLLTCKLFAAESDLTALKNISGDFFLLKGGEQLQDFYKPRKFAKLKSQILKKFGISIEMVHQMSPFALYSALGKNFVETGHSSIDEKLWLYALANGKPAIGVETAAEQMSYYELIPVKVQADMLYELVMKSANFSRKFSRMLKDYLRMDIIALYRSSKKGNKFIRKLLVYRRNDIMSKRIAEIADEQSAFIALGAGHLAGKSGIIKQLKDNGFTVKPIKIIISENNAEECLVT